MNKYQIGLKKLLKENWTLYLATPQNRHNVQRDSDIAAKESAMLPSFSYVDKFASFIRIARLIAAVYDRHIKNNYPNIP